MEIQLTIGLAAAPQGSVKKSTCNTCGIEKLMSGPVVGCSFTAFNAETMNGHLCCFHLLCTISSGVRRYIQQDRCDVRVLTANCQEAAEEPDDHHKQSPVPQ